MTDPATIVLGVIALLGATLTGVSFPAVLREHREWKRRQALTPLELASEDFVKAVNELKLVFTLLGIQAVETATAILSTLADAAKVDTEASSQ